MDEFGILTERYGLKPQGKSVPMAALKRNIDNNNAQNWNLGMDSDLNTKSSSESNSVVGSYLDSMQFTGYKRTSNNGHSDPYDDIFGGPVNSTKPTGNLGSGDGGSSFDYDSIFSGSISNGSAINSYGNDDIFGGMPGCTSSSSAKNNVNNDDIFGTFTSPPKQNAQIDDLLGGFGGAQAKPKSSYGNRSSNGAKNAYNFDDFIPGFGGINPQNSGRKTGKHPQKPMNQPDKATSTLLEDPFVVLESTSPPNSSYISSDFDPLEKISKLNNSAAAKPPRLKSPPKEAQVSKGHRVKGSGISSIDELEDFAMGRGKNNTKGRSNVPYSEEGVKITANKAGRHNGDDLEYFFSMGSRSNSVPKSRTTTPDPLFDTHTNSGKPQLTVRERTFSGSSPSIKKSSSATGIFDDLSTMFGAAQVFGEFEEVEGESEERRRARLGRLQRTKERAEKAVADMNQRDLQSRQEQEEKRRIAESVDIEIKRWAAGKEGNMRALLSSMQYVLWPECGWQPVSLTDLITSTSVKKVYRKANLYVHPDKVQQKGATLQQKYTAEKVFDILKEAWTKFNTEELR